MKEELVAVRIAQLPETEEQFLALLLEHIATPQGSAAMFILALNIFLNDQALGRACLDMVRLNEPISDGEMKAHLIPLAEQYPQVARSYIRGATKDNGYTPPEDEWVMYFKITDERGPNRKAKTVYVGCSGTDSYRPITLCTKPPKYVRKRFGVHQEYETDPWFVTEYPSLLLPIRN